MHTVQNNDFLKLKAAININHSDTHGRALMASHIYLIREREFIRLNEPVYKLGKTTQDGLKRSAQYPKGSSIEIHLRTNNCHAAETELLKYFRSSFIARTDFGAEYFEGDVQMMLVEIFKYRCTIQSIPTVPVPIVPAMVVPAMVVPATIAIPQMVHMHTALSPVLNIRIDAHMNATLDDLTRQFGEVTVSHELVEEKKESMPMPDDLHEQIDYIRHTVKIAILKDHNDPMLFKLCLKHGLDARIPNSKKSETSSLPSKDPTFRIDYASFIEEMWILYRRHSGLKIVTCAQYYKYVNINNTICDLKQKINEYMFLRKFHATPGVWLEIHIGANKIHCIDKEVYDFQQAVCCDFKKHFRDFVYTWDL